jgi:hypothetical protein
MIALGAVSGSGDKPTGSVAEPVPQLTYRAAESGGAPLALGLAAGFWQERTCDVRIPLPTALVQRLGERSAQEVVHSFNIAASDIQELLIRELPRTSATTIQLRNIVFELVDGALLVKVHIAHAATAVHAVTADLFDQLRKEAYKLLREKLQAVAGVLDANMDVPAGVALVVNRQLGERPPA